VTAPPSARERLDQHARSWRVAVERTLETETSVIAFGLRGNQAVVLKVVKDRGDEWQSAEIVRAFHGRGVVQVYESGDGAMLLERLVPGDPLVSRTVAGHDDDAVDILADVIQRMSAVSPPPGCPTVRDWAQAFDRYRERSDREIPAGLVDEASELFARLASSQKATQLLHGDLHHYNVMFDSARGWLAIDPKGVAGEIEYEIGAFLRNPVERPELFASATTVERRLARLAQDLDVNVDRVLGWGFAQAVLSAVWSVEDGVAVDASSPVLRLAQIMRGMLR
jgi:streptomycin 6-kinase